MSNNVISLILRANATLIYAYKYIDQPHSSPFPLLLSRSEKNARKFYLLCQFFFSGEKNKYLIKEKTLMFKLGVEISGR